MKIVQLARKINLATSEQSGKGGSDIHAIGFVC
jgi:hypothetical protein